MDRSDPAYRGQADYNPGFLRIYDRLVLGLFARFIWRFSASDDVARYRANIRPNHLDVGPGTGYYLEAAGLPDGSAVTILDPNPNVLAYASRRLSKLDVTAIQADVLKPLPVAGPFDSAGLNGVLHCLPGPMDRKAAAIEHIARVLAPDGVLFGMTLLGPASGHGRFARAFMRVLNRRGTFGNLEDTEEGLREILRRSFDDVRIERSGGTAAFVARNPRPRDQSAPPSD
jgi:SAM-dependent methyltransferase